MVSTRKKKQSNRRLLSQFDDFDRDHSLGNAWSDKQETVVVTEGTVVQIITAQATSNNLTTNANL